MKNLVIVESPAKARTLGKILGKSYILKASMGHIRDLPKSRLGVEIKDDFAPKYVVPRDKAPLVKELKKAAEAADNIYLATDPDREGEAISWHLAEVIKTDSKPFRRVVFHEITDEAIEQAFKHPRDIDMKLVNAQQARRVLDRLVGYKISPLLWRKIKRGLSAGRVQSVAVKIIVDREREIENFVSEEYWSIDAELAKKSGPSKNNSFRASLIGILDGKKIEIHNKEESDELERQLRKAEYSVLKTATKKALRQPAPPFITSTLQQEAWRKLHFSASQTMMLAQQLYEGLPLGEEGNVGLITYMRTDSTHVALQAIDETRDYVKARYGVEFIPAHPRLFTRTVKGAQEAHEAIRPTRIHREPRAIKQYLNSNQFKLYDLIWKRMVASQMSAAGLENTTVDIRVAGKPTDYLLRTTASIIVFAGFTILYTEGRDDSEKEDGGQSSLPSLEKGEALNLIDLFPEQHFTQPPPRFTEATLIKMLEQYGIGRPSTYAPIISTIQEREYVSKTGGSFKPTELGFLVNDLLGKHFPNIVDIDFTAQMEKELDEIANDDRDWVGVLKDFYTPFEKTLENAFQVAEKVKLADEVTKEICPHCGKPMVIKTGRFGKFLACSSYPECKTTRSYQIKTGVKCYKCGKGELLERINKKRRTFYGCSTYPACDFTTNRKPLPQPCPKCGRNVTLFKEKWVKCTDCNYRARLPESGIESKELPHAGSTAKV